jgi:D-alanine--poly(phosphoribitol) ligase subunit 1
MRQVVPSTDRQHDGQGPGYLRLVLRHATTHPGALALKDDDESLSYGELLERVAAVASGLVELGVGPGDRVATLLPNSAASIVAVLGCLWAGAPFVPLSVEDPPARVEQVLRDCDPKVVIVPGEQVSPAVAPLGVTTGRVVDLAGILSRANGAPPVSEGLERDAYMIYTSGTTGAPKGVRAPERALLSAAIAAAGAFGFEPSTRSLCVSSFHFDGSFGTVFPTLMMGGSLFIPKREDLLFLRRFFSAVLDDGITHTAFSPSYLRLLLSSSRLPTLARSPLKTLGLGGEECLALDVTRLWEVLPELRVFNRYGPTETTIAVPTYEVSRADAASGRIPIGPPHDRVSFHLVDEDGNVVEGADETGELWIGGAQLMRGYWRDEPYSAEVLRDDIIPGKTLYKTGDLVWRDVAGRYFYAGRVDDVVKRNGVRISLTEVALALRRVEGVSAATCLLTDLDGRTALAAFVEAPEDMTPQVLLGAAGEYLPAAMLPDEVFVVPKLPMTTSGKVDRARLRAEVGRDSPETEGPTVLS